MTRVQAAFGRLFFALALAPSAAMADCTTRAYAAIAADIVTTEIALSSGAAEANPLYGSDPDTQSLLVVGAARAGVAWILDGTRGEFINCHLARGTFAVAVSNLAVAAGVDQPEALAIGLSVTLPFW